MFGRFRVGFGAGCRGELFGKTLVLGAGGVEVAFRSLGADAQRVAGLFEGGDASVGGGSELVERVPVVGPDAGGLVGCGGVGVLGADNGGCLALVGSGGVLLGLLGTCLGVVDLAAASSRAALMSRSALCRACRISAAALSRMPRTSASVAVRSSASSRSRSSMRLTAWAVASSACLRSACAASRSASASLRRWISSASRALAVATRWSAPDQVATVDEQRAYIKAWWAEHGVTFRG